MSPVQVEVDEVARALQVSIGLLRRQLRQSTVGGTLTLPEAAALARLERGGPATSSALARVEQISPQSMGTTLAALQARGLVERRADPDDGRRAVVSVTDAGVQALRDKRDARTHQLAAALSTDFSPAELRQLSAAAPLIERLALSI